MEIEKVSGDYRPLILVAEDDDSNFKLIKAIIGKKCEILWAKNGEDIVNLFEENRDKAEAILMDIKNAYYERAGCYGDYSQEG
jgi:Response regulator receiver domain.